MEDISWRIYKRSNGGHDTHHIPHAKHDAKPLNTVYSSQPPYEIGDIVLLFSPKLLDKCHCNFCQDRKIYGIGFQWDCTLCMYINIKKRDISPNTLRHGPQSVFLKQRSSHLTLQHRMVPRFPTK